MGRPAQEATLRGEMRGMWGDGCNRNLLLASFLNTTPIFYNRTPNFSQECQCCQGRWGATAMPAARGTTGL